jgi:hypothetical protein
MHADRTNRTMLLLLALLLIAAGAAAGAASIGAFGTTTRHSPLIDNPAGNFTGTPGGWALASRRPGRADPRAARVAVAARTAILHRPRR